MPRRRPGAALGSLLLAATVVVGVLLGAVSPSFASPALKVSLSLSPSSDRSTVLMTAVIAPASTKGTVSFVVDGRTIHRSTHTTTGAEAFSATGLTIGEHHLQAAFDPAAGGLATVGSSQLAFAVTAVAPTPSPPPGADPQTIEVTVPPHAVQPTIKPSVLGTEVQRTPPGSTSGQGPGSTSGQGSGGVLGGALPFTGADIWILLIIAAALLLVGMAIMRASRRTAWLTGTAAVLGATALLWLLGAGASGSPAPVPPVQKSAAGTVIWPGPEPDITVHDAAGRVLQVDEPVKPGELVRVDATGFLPQEEVSLGDLKLRATSTGAVTYSFRATTSTDLVFRGSDLTSAWHLNTT